MLTRREFSAACASYGAGLLCCPFSQAAAKDDPRKAPVSSLRPAMFWDRSEDGKARCMICPNKCARDEGGVTFCNTRINRGGKMYSMIHSRPCVLNNDSLQKNPLYHVAPGTQALGVATAGCNLRCSYCQNWEISQTGPWDTRNLGATPADVIRLAKERDLGWITFSYTDPVAYFEYAYDIAKLAQKAGLKVAVVTAGMIYTEPLKALIEVADAFSVTLKGTTGSFYKQVCQAQIKRVWRTIETLAESDKWVEVINLVVTGLNDKEKDFRAIATSVYSLNPEIPLHYLRFSPAYKLKHLPKTPVRTLERAREISLEKGIKYVYVDLPGHEGATTRCPKCGQSLIERSGFAVLANRIVKGRCSQCRTPIPGLDLCKA